MPIVSQLTGQYRPGHRTRTLTTLPEFPGIPLYAPLLSRQSRPDPDPHREQDLDLANHIVAWTPNSEIHYQAAYLEFLREVAAKLRVPLIVNMDRKSLILVTVAFPRRGPRSGLGC